MRGRARACAHGGTTRMHVEDCPHTRRMPFVPQFLGHNIPIYEEGALISAVTAVMQECCRKFPPRIFPEIHGGCRKFPPRIFPELRGGHTFIVMEKKVSNYIAGFFPIEPGRRYTLSIYSTTTPELSVHRLGLILGWL